jgi:hypothetical protein
VISSALKTSVAMGLLPDGGRGEHSAQV